MVVDLRGLVLLIFISCKLHQTYTEDILSGNNFKIIKDTEKEIPNPNADPTKMDESEGPIFKTNQINPHDVLERKVS